MSLKQSIVVVNEFTYKMKSGTGSRGSSPQSYVVDYMARLSAAENVTPTRLQDSDDMFLTYRRRAKTSHLGKSIPKIKEEMKRAKGKGGIAFSNDDASLSDERLRVMGRFMQDEYERGKTIFKTVLSFDEEWLKEHGLIDDTMSVKRRGDLRGRVDQLKIRYAVMHGLSKMARNFDDLRFVGVVQVDTRHLHVHLAMVDHGRGRVRPDGLQRGKLTDNDMMRLRRGIDDYLDRKQCVKALSSSVMHDRRNAVCYLKQFAHKTLLRQGLPQFLIACLPDNRNFWRASTNRKEMRKANAIIREYVVNVLREPSSGYREAMTAVVEYADYRQRREGFSQDVYNKLVREGQERIIIDGMNAVYSVLRRVPKEELVVNTPTIDIMSADISDIVQSGVRDPAIEFGFKLRSYSSRLKHHREEYHKYRDERQNYDKAENKSEDSAALGDYMLFERDYNMMLMVKYQYFLSFLPPDEEFEEEFNQLMKRKERLAALRKMKEDKAFQRLSERAAYEYGLQVYGQRGGDKVRYQPVVIERRIEFFEKELADAEAVFREKLRDHGFDYDGRGVTRRKAYPFDDVKMLDLHHMGYDFPSDIMISRRNIMLFCDTANERYEKFCAARDYLVRSGQEELVKQLPQDDVAFMKEYADSLQAESDGRMISSRIGGGQISRKYTISLSKDYVTDMAAVIKSAIKAVHIDDLQA